MERAGKLGLLNWLSRAWQSRKLHLLCKHSGWFKQLPRLRAFLYRWKTFMRGHLKHSDGVFRDERWRSIERILGAILRWWMERTGGLGLRSSWDLTVCFLELCVLCKQRRWFKPVPQPTPLGWRKRRSIQPRIRAGCLQCQTRSPWLLVLLEGSRCIRKFLKLIRTRPMGLIRRNDLSNRRSKCLELSAMPRRILVRWRLVFLS